MDESIYEKLTRYCSYQERCEADVAQKFKALKAAGSPAIYVQRLRQENYLNEERYVKAFVNGHVRKKWGKTKIKMALLRKGLPAAPIQRYLSEVEEDNYQERLLKAAEQKWSRIKATTDRERKMKLFSFLLAKGYESKDIQKVMAQLAKE
ncbi:MAG: RecX family transcriptional regulator [Bacteroidetes bacterium]|nr:RecX family transcriptional regulator [Bacteroidota bacterium]